MIEKQKVNNKESVTLRKEEDPGTRGKTKPVTPWLEDRS